MRVRERERERERETAFSRGPGSTWNPRREIERASCVFCTIINKWIHRHGKNGNTDKNQNQIRKKTWELDRRCEEMEEEQFFSKKAIFSSLSLSFSSLPGQCIDRRVACCYYSDFTIQPIMFFVFLILPHYIHHFASFSST